MRPFILAMVVLTGCGESPEDLFHITGVVTSGEQLVREQRLELWRGAPRGELTSSPCAPTKDLGSSITSQSGDFSFELFRAEVESPGQQFGGSACLRLRTQLHGVSSWIDLENEHDTRSTDVGALAAWRPDVGLIGEPGDGGLRLELEPQPPVPQAVARRVRTSLVVDGGLWWDAVLELTDAGVTRLSQTISPEWLEDRAVTVRLEAATVGAVTVGPRFNPTVGLSGPTSHLARFGALVDPGLALAGQLTPVSRGASCAGLATPCPLTDGEVEPIALDGGTVIELELAAPSVVRKVALRSLRYGFSLELNLIVLIDADTGDHRVIAGFGPDGGQVGPPGDGRQPYGWPLFSELDGFLLLDVDPPLPPGRRYQLAFALPIRHLTEVSFFDR